MEKLVKMSSLYRCTYRRSGCLYAPAAAGTTAINHHDHQSVSRRYFHPSPQRLSSSGFDAKEGTNSSESTDDFEERIFGDVTGEDNLYQKLDRLGKPHDQPDRSGLGSRFNASRGVYLDGLDNSFSKLSDGMDEKLKSSAEYFGLDEEEICQEDFKFRPDMTFTSGNTYELKDLDIRQPGFSKPPVRDKFEVTTEEVLRKADFRNVRFLANFITEAGVIIKRSHTKISAKAQRKVAREIKTARAFGLMPFTTMGTKHFVFGKTMENLDQDYEYETYNTQNFVEEDLES